MELTTFNLATLGMLHRAPRSGYDVRRELAATPVGPFSDSPGAVYPALRKLEAHGLIAGRVAADDTLRPKRVFRLTPKGRRVLEARLRAPVTRRDVIWSLDELMIRFVYAEEILGRAGTLELTRAFLREVKAFTEEFAAYVEEVREGQSLTARLALENGLESYRQQLRWAQRALRTLESTWKEPVR